MGLLQEIAREHMKKEVLEIMDIELKKYYLKEPIIYEALEKLKKQFENELVIY